MNRKVNPRHRPANQQDIERAAKQASDVAMRSALYLTLWVMCNDLHFTHEQIAFVQDRLNDLCDSVARGYVKYADIAKTLEEEFEVTLKIE